MNLFSQQGRVLHWQDSKQPNEIASEFKLRHDKFTIL